MSTSRYLTAQKVCLLVLLKLYCESAIPSSATIPILSFIVTHATPSTPSWRARRSSEQADASFAIHAFEDVLQPHASIMPGRTLLDVFLKKLWEINSFDALHDLFGSLSELLAKEGEEAEPHQSASRAQILLSKVSPLGAFVRRARLEFTRLQFDDAMKLWTTVIAYRAPTAQWTQRIAGIAAAGVDVNTSKMALHPGDGLFEVAYGRLGEEIVDDSISTDDLERLLEFQLDRLQRLGCRVPDQMRARLRSMLGPTGMPLRQSHLVKFFDAWRAGDYTSAFDNIHRYYDYAMQTREKIHYQYALLHMAILQAEFGCFSEAIAAINETISTARENQDMTCLNFSLSWLHHMANAYPKQMKGSGYRGMLGSERDGLTFLKTKAKESKMYSLLSATLLNESKLFLSTGESVPRAVEQMYQASHLNIKENINSQGAQMLLQSTLYSRLGITHLSDVYCDLLLHCYGDSCPIDEHIRAVCRCAFSLMQSGRYEEALRLLDAIDPAAHRTLKFHQYVFFCTGIVKLKRAIRRGDWTSCASLFTSLKPDSSTDPEITFHLYDARIDYLLSRSDFPTAHDAIEEHAAALRDQGADIFQRLALLLMKATLFAKVGHAERAFSVALRAANVAFKARLMPSLWSAVGQLANILNGLGEYRAAAKLLQAVVPQALEHTDLALTGMLHAHLADSYVGLAGLDNPETSSGARLRLTNISQAEMYIDRARECYKKIEDTAGECEQLMKKAIIAKLRGDEKLAEEWAENHNRVWEAAKQKREAEIAC